jgi:hypothetical protein
MGFFDKLMGRDTPVPATGVFDPRKGWAAASEKTRRATTQAVLERAAALAGVTDGVAYAETHDGTFDLRGTIQGLPFRVKMSESGSIDDFELKYAKRDFTYIDLEYDRDLPEHNFIQPPDWEPSDKRVFFAPKIFVEGSSADREAAAFKQLPESLQKRTVAAMRQYDILYFRSRYDELEITISRSSDDEPTGDPIAGLADMLRIAADFAIARGVKPPGDTSTSTSDDDDGSTVTVKVADCARSIAAKITGATVVDRAPDECLDVRWTEHGIPVRIVLDHGFDDVDVEVAIPKVHGAFDLSHEPSLDPDSLGPPVDLWDVRTRQELIGPKVCVSGTPTAVARQTALVRSIGPSLVVELVAAMAEHSISNIELADGLLKTTLSDLEELDAAAAIRVAKLFVRVAAALPSS